MQVAPQGSELAEVSASLPNVAEKLPKKERQAKVANLLVAGWNQARIAAHFGVNEGTISRDVKELDARFRVLAEQDIRLARGIDLERIDNLLAAIWPKAMNRANPHQVSAVRVAKELIEARARIMGSEAPQTVNASVSALVEHRASFGERLTPEQQDAVYEAMIVALEEAAAPAAPSGG